MPVEKGGGGFGLWFVVGFGFCREIDEEGLNDTILPAGVYIGLDCPAHNRQVLGSSPRVPTTRSPLYMGFQQFSRSFYKLESDVVLPRCYFRSLFDSLLPNSKNHMLMPWY